MAKKDIKGTEAVQEPESNKAVSPTETTSEKKGNEDAETLDEDTEESANESRDDAQKSESSVVDTPSEEAAVAASGIPQIVKDAALRSFELHPHLRTVYVISNGCAFASIHFAQNAARYLEDTKVYTIEK